MKKNLLIAALSVMIVSPVVVAAPAMALDQDRYERRGDRYDRNDRVYRGRDDRHSNRRRCDGGSGATGTIAGGAGGAVLGNVVGGGTLGTIAGGVGGALLGRHIDKKNVRSRNGC